MSELSVTEILHAWEDLQENAAWKLLQEAASEQMELRARTVLYEPLTAEGVYDREKLRGEHNGIELILRLAESMFEQAQADYATFVKEQNNEREA